MSGYDWSWYFNEPDHLSWSNDRLMAEYYARDEDALARTLARIRDKRGERVSVAPVNTGEKITLRQCEALEQRGLLRRLPEGNAAVRFIPR